LRSPFIAFALPQVAAGCPIPIGTPLARFIDRLALLDAARHEEEPAMTTTTSTSSFRPYLWTAGDLNAFFGFGTNILTNMLTLTILLRFVIDAE
jgi:hypothetical protein